MATESKDGPTARDNVRGGVHKALLLLPPDGRRKLGLLIGANMATSVLDLIGVLLVGLLTWVLVAFVGGDSDGPKDVSFLGHTFSTAEVVSIRGMVFLGFFAAGFLITKSIVGTYLTRRTLRYLANRQAAATLDLAQRVFRGPLVAIEQRTTQETSFALLGGVNAAVVGLLGAAALAMSEVALLVLLGCILLVVNPLVSIGAILFFAALAAFMHKVLGSWAGATGAQLSTTGFALTQWVQETIASFRELTVLDRMYSQPLMVANTMGRFAHASATSTFIAQLPKYVYETALLLGALALGAFQFATRSPAEAVATISIFLAAGSRILPAMLRLQNDVVSIKHSIGLAQPTFELAERFPAAPSARSGSHGAAEALSDAKPNEQPFVPSVALESVCARYPGSGEQALTGVTLRIAAGMRVALVGPTGSGKSTLADVVMGILPVSSGDVSINGVDPLTAITTWPGRVAYVPQTVALAEGTILTNVALGIPRDEIDLERAEHALESARLLDELRAQRLGLETEVGERGVRLSGGQRQRLGLARALYSHPSLLVLDEATSALDAETELRITAMLSELQGSVTTIVVAHRLATIRDADLVVYVNEGAIEAQGTFDEVRQQVGRFAESARILGL